MFDATSGQTHQLAGLAAAVLLSFEAGSPLTRDALIDALRTDFGMAIDVACDAAVDTLVEQLARLGLIVPVATDAAV